MTKNEYIRIRQSDPQQLLYMRYKEKFNKEKHKPFLNEQQFMQIVLVEMNPNLLLQSVVKEYDDEFEIVMLLTKDNQLIKIL